MSGLRNSEWRQHVALDVGTATTRIAAGRSFIEKPSRIGGKRGLASGVVVDGETVLQILKPVLDGTKTLGILKPLVLACVPSDARPDERELLVTSIMRAGAAKLSIIPEPLAAAIGSGVDVSSSYAHMVLDIGEGVTDCAVVQSGRIAATCAIRNGCADMRNAIVQAARSRGWADCSETCAEALLRACGLAGVAVREESALVAEALQGVLEKVADTLTAFFMDLPDSMACDIIDSGICLTGGGALVPGVRAYLEQRLRLSIQVAKNPLASVAEGARAILPVILSVNS